MNVALAADIRIAAEKRSSGNFCQRVGLFPDYGGTYFLHNWWPIESRRDVYNWHMIDAQTALKLDSSIASCPARNWIGGEEVCSKAGGRSA